MIICISYLIGAVRLPFGSINEPGPGFLPMILGTIGIILSAFLLGKNILGRDRSEYEKTENLPPLVFYIGSIIGLAIFFKWLGSLLGIFLLILVLMKASRLSGWRLPAVISLVASLVIYLIFAYWLKVSMPAGILSSLI